MTSQYMTEIESVIDGDFCIGCGACKIAAKDSIKLIWDKYGKFRATIKDSSSHVQDSLNAASVVCPFSGCGANEDDIARQLYPELPDHGEIGRFRKTYAGWVAKGLYREAGSSGGLTTWICCRLLEEGLVDAVVHVKPVNPVEHNGRLFQYGISSCAEEVRAGAKSRYYPIEMSDVLEQVRKSPFKRFVFVGLPCFVKAVRLLARQDNHFATKIAYCVSLFCGHLKSAAFAELLAWQAGIKPEDLNTFDFRHKLVGRSASRYGFCATSRSTNEETVKPMSSVFGGNWGHGVFKYNACDYCDDVVGETADISIGDAWLPEYVNDYLGTNVVIVRHPDMEQLMESGQAKETIHLDPIDVDQVAKSQRSGLTHRRQGLAYRLALKESTDDWYPPKRVQPSFEIPHKRKVTYDLRILLAQRSHDAFANAKQEGTLDIFFTEIQPLIDDYNKIYRQPLQMGLLTKLKLKLKRVIKWLTNIS